MLLEHLIVQVISLVVAVFGLSFFMQYNWGKIFITIMTLCFYVVQMYSRAYKLGEKDSKSYSEHKPYPLKGLAICGLVFVVTGVAWVFYKLSIGASDGGVELAFRLLFRNWNFYIIQLFDFGGKVRALFYVLMLAMPVFSCVLGYIAGMKRFKLMTKFINAIVYKK